MNSIRLLTGLLCASLNFFAFSCEQMIENLTEPKDRYYISNQTMRDFRFVTYKEGEIVKEDTIAQYKEVYLEDGYFFTDSTAFFDLYNPHTMMYRNLQFEEAGEEMDLRGHFYYGGSWQTQDDTHYTFVFPGF